MRPRGMADDRAAEEAGPIEAFLETTRVELTQVRNQAKEISLLVEQSQGEVDKLVQRNAAITSRLHQIQSNFDTVPREDIRAAYEAAQDGQQRLFSMRGQLEKLQSDQGNLKRYSDFLAKTIQLLEGGVEVASGPGPASRTELLEQLIQAQEEERRKISRQIHDGPAQALSNFILQTEIALRLFDSDQEKAREELSSLKAAAATTFSSVRDYIFDLRPMMLDDLGLVPTVRRYTEALGQDRPQPHADGHQPGAPPRVAPGGAVVPGGSGAAGERARVRPGDPGQGHHRHG